MMTKIKFVVDTNVLLSQLLWPTSFPVKAFRKALSIGTFIVSNEVIAELTEVLSRKKFDPYISIEERQSFLRQLSLVVEYISHVVPLKACRDPKDDKFLSLAVAGRATFILTGDKDLLELDPFHGVRIIESSSFLEESLINSFTISPTSSHSLHERAEVIK